MDTPVWLISFCLLFVFIIIKLSIRIVFRFTVSWLRLALFVQDFLCLSRRVLVFYSILLNVSCMRHNFSQDKSAENNFYPARVDEKVRMILQDYQTLWLVEISLSLFICGEMNLLPGYHADSDTTSTGVISCNGKRFTSRLLRVMFYWVRDINTMDNTLIKFWSVVHVFPTENCCPATETNRYYKTYDLITLKRVPFTEVV